jgi:tRNA modification GTPase
LENLQEKMAHIVALAGVSDGDTVTVTSLRHHQALTMAADTVRDARESLLAVKPLEIVALELHEALEHLDKITGRALPDEVLDRIFSTFCIGK